MGRVAALLVLAAAFQADENAMGKLKAPQVLAKAQLAWAKKNGCHVELDLASALLSADLLEVEKAKFNGKLLKGLMALQGEAELYGRGPEKLIRKDKEFVEPRAVDGKTNRVGIVTRNPAVVVADLFRFAAAATFGADEKIGDADCRILETAADEKAVGEHIKEVSGGLKTLDKYFIKDLLSVSERKKSTSVYKAWLKKADLMPVRIEWTLTIVVSQGSIGGEDGPGQFDVRCVYHFSKFDSELDVELPPPVRKKFGAP